MLLTYKSFLNKKSYITWAKEKFKTQGIEFIRLAHEHGKDDPETPYEHTHVLIRLGKRCNLTGARTLDYTNIHPHIKVLPNKKAFLDAKIYIAKEDPENEDLKRRSCYELVEACPDPKELMKFVGEPGSATGLIAMHNIIHGGKMDYRTEIPNWDDFKPRAWQHELKEFLFTRKPDGRSINWICDVRGGAGKSVFCDWVEDISEGDFQAFDDIGTARDAATIIMNTIIAGWKGKGFILDLSRMCENHDRMYDYLERIANGRITTVKYSGKKILFDKPHVVVFAN